uniref:Uncharacterized protein LOC103340144 isoform X1 n=1 Tax=Rhizophora mucronata TaxID=61149 RepID=A0A2P2KB59_RHIMU
MLSLLWSRCRRSSLSGGRACKFEAMQILRHICIVIIAAVVLQAIGAASVVVPSSNCYAFDNSSHLVDFSSLIGQPFTYEEKDKDLVVRFCKDVETRSQTGYVDFGRFDRFSYFDAGSGNIDFVQGFYNGDLTYCEGSYDKWGRTAHVDIICGSCLNGQCKGWRMLFRS